MELRQRLHLTYLFISHDLGVVRHISDRVVIMYLGRVVESGPTDALFAAPNHPYTQALLANVPTLESRKKSFAVIKGEIPSPIDPPTGCHFHPRCPNAMPRCKAERPALREIAPGRISACHLNEG
jgi:peptide/nickel transport system ATP-binding protein